VPLKELAFVIPRTPYHLFGWIAQSLVAGLVVLGASVRPAHAQELDPASVPKTPAGGAAVQPSDPNPGAVTLSGGVDFLNQYMLRGIRQNSTGVAIWPAADLAIAAYAGDGRVKGVVINVGTWNSLHTGDTGTAGPTRELWYESDFYTTLGLGLGRGVSFSTTYVVYVSPNNSFTTVKELMFKLALDDTARLGRAAVKPYVLIARELDTAPGRGQLDNGAKPGTYLELGISPAGYLRPKASLTIPVKVGLSLSNYYELAGTDKRFGFLSIAGVVTVPLGSSSTFGAWNIHGGAEFQKLGDMAAFFNGNNRSQVIGSIGIGFSY
jgi:hypothetical protein